MRAIERVDDDEPGLRILAEVIQAVADRERGRRPTLRLVSGEAVVRVPFAVFAHGEARCPSCGLHVDSRDVTRRIWDDPIPGTRPLGVNVEHKRCGTIFTIEFDRESAP